MTPEYRQELIVAIAAREGTARELSKRFDIPITELRAFSKANAKAIRIAAEALEDEDTYEPPDIVTPSTLGDLWIADKSARLKRYELIADRLFSQIMAHPSADATELRELRFYMTAAANELGQLLHRGAGEQSDGDKLQVEFLGVDPNSFS